MNGQLIYEPAGRAREYAALACNIYRGCDHACSYCLTGDALVTKADLSVIPIREIAAGDKLLGLVFRKHHSGTNQTRFRETTVLHAWSSRKRAYRVDLDNGMSATCSADHRWLTDRGWKFTTGAMSGPAQRPYLTAQNSVRVLSAPSVTPAITDDYKRGYLSGIIRGDGHIGTHGPYERNAVRKNRGDKLYHRVDYQHQFTLRMKDQQALDRTESYLTHFGIPTFSFRFTDNMNGIRTSRRASVDAITGLIGWGDSREYARGFAAGLYDAEGSFSSQQTIRITNSDPAILAHLEASLSVSGLGFAYDTPKEGPNTIIQTLRLTGGRDESVRFFQWADPVIARKRSLSGSCLNKNAHVAAIHDLNREEMMYDIETSSGNFIANGMASHNCYAPAATRRAFEIFSHPEPRADFLRALGKEACKLKPTEAVLLCFTCDPYMALDEQLGLTRETIKILHAAGHAVHILTKGGSRALRDIDILGSGDAFATTLTLLDETASLEWEPGAALPADRIATIRDYHAAGIPTWVSLEPVLDPAIALEIIRRTHEFVDLFKVGRWNYHADSKLINWAKFASDAVALLESLGKRYYIKKDLACFLPEGHRARSSTAA